MYNNINFLINFCLLHNFYSKNAQILFLTIEFGMEYKNVKNKVKLLFYVIEICLFPFIIFFYSILFCCPKLITSIMFENIII